MPHPLISARDDEHLVLLQNVITLHQNLRDDQASLRILVQEQHEALVQKLEDLVVTGKLKKPSDPPLTSSTPLLQSCEEDDKQGLQLDKRDWPSETSSAEAGEPGPGEAEPDETGAVQAAQARNRRKSQAESVEIDHIYKKSGLMKAEHEQNIFTRIVESKFFKHTISLAILGNSVFVGADVEMGMQRALDGETSLDHPGMWWGGHVFTFLFTLELFFKVPAYRAHFFLGPDWRWNTFDTIIVVAAWADLLFSGIGGVKALRALRVLRLTRTLRILRVVTVFRPLMLIIQSLTNSLLSLLWMLVLLLFVMYLVTVVFMGGAASFIVDELNASDVPMTSKLQDMTYEQLRDAFREMFRTVFRGMLTMFCSVTGGQDWFETLKPFMIASWMYAVVFVAFVVFVVFGVFNVLAAVFVEHVLTNRDKDLMIQSEQAKTKVFMKDMADLFSEGDTDHNGRFSLEELTEHCTKPRFCSYLNSHALDATDAEALFEFMDADGGGEVDVEEFVTGALKLKGPGRRIDVLQVHGDLKKMNKRLDTIQQLFEAA